MQHENWQCPKCTYQKFETDQFTATGGDLPKNFGVQNKKFTTVTCLRCKYTEIYKTDTLGDLPDFIGKISASFKKAEK